MSAKDAHLYHVPHAKKKQSGKEITTSGSLAFGSQLSSLISAGKSSGDRPSAGRSHRKKEDIFATHNRNTSKRARRDVENDCGAFEIKKSAPPAEDPALWHRSKRRMEEKARLYAAMKRGDVDDEDGKHMVDFDRKWAEKEDGEEGRWENESSDGSRSEPEEEIEWTDEFGRTRKGTRTQMLRAQRQVQVAQEMDERLRPAAPSQIIYGDTVQSAAFNPETNVVERMAELAAKRDRSLTPPPDMHFDSSKEVRHKGVGFMQLSLDAEERKKQMEGLERDRSETEKKRGERDERLNARKEMLEKRKQEIAERRGKRKADEFLAELDKEMEAKQDGV